MSTEHQDLRERRVRSRALIDKMLADRQQMLVLLCKVSGLQPFTPKKPVKSLLEKFCQILVDYIAAAHFGLYERIGEGRERRRPVVEVTNNIYPQIAETTQTVVDFNERYDKKDGCEFLDTLQEDLSHLGEVLAHRIELEDQLIEAMLGGSVTAPETHKAH